MHPTPTPMATTQPTKVTNKHPWDQDQQNIYPLEALKLVLFAPVALLRFVLIVLWFAVWTPALSLCAFLASRSDPPNSTWQWLLHKSFKIVSRGFLFILGVWHIKVFGKPVARDGRQNQKVVFVGNHTSLLDGWTVNATVPFMIVGVSKLSGRNMLWLGEVLDALGFCWVDHMNPGVGGTSLIVDHIKSPDTPNLILAPEGTTTNGQSLLQFRTGAFVAGNPVQPMLLRYPSKFFCPAFTDMNGNLIVYRMLCFVYCNIEVTFLPVHHPTDEERRDPKLFAENVRCELARVGKLPLCEVSGYDLLKNTDVVKTLQPRKPYLACWQAFFGHK